MTKAALMLETTSVLDLDFFFQILEYLYMQNAIIFGMVPKSKLKIYLFLYNILFNFAYQTKFNNVELSICGILSTQKAWNINAFRIQRFQIGVFNVSYGIQLT